MSYNGTVRCGQCHNKGHNKRSCPELKRLAAADPNGYYGRQVARMEAASSRPRKCSYCKEPGHTRRTCSTMKTHKREARQDTTLVRKGLQKWIEASGLGPGALIASRRSFYNRGYQEPRTEDEQPRVFLVNELNLDEITQRDGLPGNREAQRLIRATDVASGSQVWFGLPHVPTVAPATGYSRGHRWEQSRLDNDGHKWTLASPAPTVAAIDGIFGTPLVEQVEDWFASDQQNESFQFDTICPEQRKAIREYLNDSEGLPSEWAQTVPENG